MTGAEKSDTLLALLESIRRKAPEYFDLLTAKTDAEFESSLDALLEAAIAQLESNKGLLAGLTEEGLSAVLAGNLSVPGLTVTRETHSNGHVDLTITADHCMPARKVLGEAKIWRGEAYHVDGVGQLLERYTTGREGRGIIIEYVKLKNIKRLFGVLRTAMNRDRPHGQVKDADDHSLRWSFITEHEHTSGEVLRLGHIGCNLFGD